MKISSIMNKKEVTLSFEVFPPKNTDSYEAVVSAANQIAALRPDYMSVTYGAGGGTSQYTLDVADQIQKKYGIPALAHLSCISSTRNEVSELLEQMKVRGIENILALRGDRSKDSQGAADYGYAAELIADIKQKGDFTIGAACYPEGHTEAKNKTEDIRYLKEKVEAGCDFITTQMFFDNNILYNFLYRIREMGITVPVVAGIIPVTNARQIKRICQLSGTNLPARFQTIVDYFGEQPEGMKQAGIAYATEQIIDLIANGAGHIHVYSMNKPDVAASILKNLKYIQK